jgi:hypothetical protein
MRKILILLSVLALAGCTPAVSMDAAEYANHPGCAEVSVRLPDAISDLPKRYTNAQATSAWGEPAAILLRCGLEKVEISALPCVTAGVVDWLVDDSMAPNYRFISFATEPAVEVIVDSINASGITALEAISQAVSMLEVTKKCSTVTN